MRLKIIYENCIAKGVFPQIWKQANVVPVHKKDSKYVKENYRPISLLPVFGKMFEILFMIIFISISVLRNCLVQATQAFVQMSLQ